MNSEETGPEIEARRPPAEARAVFARDVVEGLSRPRKEILAKYLYDARGAELFDAITEVDEYYPTRTELGILDSEMPAIAERLGPRCTVIEPGSGAGLKTRRFLAGLERPTAYMPIEIAREYLEASVPELQAAFPAIEILPVHGDFTEISDLPVPAGGTARRVLFFPGSTIGNFRPAAARAFLERARGIVGSGGLAVRDLNRAVDWNLPDDEATTVAGLVIHEARAIPEVGQTFTFHGYRFQVLRKNRNRITTLRVTPLTRKEASAANRAS
jgi:uncharacterized SAM-dependent methyltransferase